MKTYNAVIIDDEEGNIIILKELLIRFIPNINIIGTANNKNEGVKIIMELMPQIVFLDIEMPYGNGFDLLMELKEKGNINFETIIISAFESYALTAFQFSAVDYLLKPVSIEFLKIATSKSIKNIENNQKGAPITNLLNNFENPNKNIAVPWQNGIKFIELNNIKRLEASGSYTFIYTQDESKIIATKTIGELEDLLPTELFFRIHHSHVVQKKFIKEYVKGRGGLIEMKDGTNLPVSTRKKDAFLNWL